MRDWRTKAQDEILKLCRQSYVQANTRKDGKRYKKHQAYAVPVLAEELVDCLNTEDEERAKAIFLFRL